MRPITIVMVSMSLLILGCNLVSDMKGMLEKQGEVQEAIKEDYGLQTQVGWNIHMLCCLLSSSAAAVAVY